MTATETLEVKLAALKNWYSFIMYRCGVLPAPVWGSYYRKGRCLTLGISPRVDNFLS